MINLVDTLSERQKEVFDLLIAGGSNQEIADCLMISVSCIKFHLKNVYGKLGVENRAKAIAYGLQGYTVQQPVTGELFFTEKQIREAVALLVEKKLATRYVVNELLTDLLAALGGKL